MTSGTDDRRTDRVRPIPEFDGVHDIWPRGERLAAIGEAATRFRTQG